MDGLHPFACWDSARARCGSLGDFVAHAPSRLDRERPWLGWALWYGSVAVFSAFVVFWAVVNFVVVPREERSLEARFGDTYREYKAKKPRWFGTLC